jgi:hypothetical protein
VPSTPVAETGHGAEPPHAWQNPLDERVSSFQRPAVQANVGRQSTSAELPYMHSTPSEEHAAPSFGAAGGHGGCGPPLSSASASSAPAAASVVGVGSPEEATRPPHPEATTTVAMINAGGSRCGIREASASRRRRASARDGRRAIRHARFPSKPLDLR